MTQAERVLKQYLRSRGLKYTHERKTLLEAITAFPGHFDADALYEWVKGKHAKLSRATVYRSIPHFIEAGLIKESLRAEGRTNYESSFGIEHHDHLVCIACGAIIEFKDDRIEDLQNRVCKKYGFKAVDHKLGIRGYCSACQNKIISKDGQ